MFVRAIVPSVLSMSLLIALDVRATDPAHAPAAHRDSHASAAPSAVHEEKGVESAEAIQMLKDGNERFVTQSSNRPHQDQARLCETFTSGQHPYAAILSCADSRVPVELVFDAGIGDLFTTRVAGNVADGDEIGTIEYGVDHLGINLIAVVGHSKCGAVTAVVNHAQVTPNIEKLVDNIIPAAEAAQKANPKLSGAALVEKATRLNVQQSMSDLQAKSDLIRQRVKSGQLRIIGGVYDLHTGKVEWLDATSVAASDDHDAPVAKPQGHETKPEAATHHNDKHSDAGDAAHDAKHDEHATAHDSPATAHDSPATAHDSPVASPRIAKAPKDNFMVLGALLGGASLTSGVIFYAMRGRSA